MGKDPLFVNKVAGAVLSAGLLALMAGFIADQIYHPVPLAKPAFAIAAGAAGSAPTQTAAAPSGPAMVGPMLAAANVENGKKVAKKCASCHTFEKGGKNKIGPNLWNVVGAKQAGVAGFGYSNVLKGMGKNWEYEELSKFLYKPKDYAKGTKMSYAGLKKDKDRADLIAYLRSLSDSPKPMP